MTRADIPQKSQTHLQFQIQTQSYITILNILQWNPSKVACALNQIKNKVNQINAAIISKIIVSLHENLNVVPKYVELK